MTELKSRIHDKSNGLDYVLVGDYYVPDLKLPEEHRPIGMWGRLHRTYLEQYRPTRFSALCLSGELHTYEEYGRTMYMWYYNDLESNKRGDCLSYSVDVPE